MVPEKIRVLQNFSHILGVLQSQFFTKPFLGSRSPKTQKVSVLQRKMLFSLSPKVLHLPFPKMFFSYVEGGGGRGWDLNLPLPITNTS